MTLGTYTSGGFKEMDATNMPGWYSFCPPNAALATGANNVALHLKGATNMVPLPLEVQLNNLDLYDGVRAGLTAIPNAAAGATGGADCTVSFGGTASAGTATSITLAGGSATDNIYNHQVVQIVGGTGIGQARVITNYVGSTKVAIVSRSWRINPDNTSMFAVKGTDLMPTVGVLSGLAVAATGTTITLTNLAVATDSYYNGCLVIIGGGTGVTQTRVIKSYVGSTQVATIDRAWTTTPDTTSVFLVLQSDQPATDASLQVAANAVNGNVTGSVGSVTGAVGSVTGAVGSVTGAVGSVVGAVGSVTGNVGGNVVGSVASVTAAVDILQSAADKVWASATRTLTAISGTILGAVWDALRSGHTTAGSFGEGVASVQGNVTGSVASVSGAVGSVTGAVGSVTAAVSLSAADSPAVTTGTAAAGGASTVTLVAPAAATASLYIGETIKIVSGTGAGQTRSITAYTVGRLATVDRPWTTVPDATSVYAVLATDTAAIDASLQVAANAVNGNVTGSVGSVTGSVGGSVVGSVGSVGSGGITAATFGAGALGATWDELRSGHTVIGSMGQGVSSVQGNVTGNVNGSVNSVTTAVDILQTAADKVWGTTVRTLSAAGVQAIWDALTSALTTAGSIGLRLVTDIDAAISSRLASGSYTAPPSAASISTTVWSEPVPGAFGAGTAGADLAQAATGGDPWATALPGAYASGTAGHIVGTDLDATISSRLAPTVGGRTLDVAATGEAGLDFDNIHDATGPHTLTNVTVPVVTTAGNVSGSVTGSVGSVTGAVGSVTAPVTVGTNSDKTGYTLSAPAIAAVLSTALAELTQGQPPAAPTVQQALMLVYHAFRDTRTITATTDAITNDAGVVIAKSTLSDDGTVFTRSKMVSGP